MLDLRFECRSLNKKINAVKSKLIVLQPRLPNNLIEITFHFCLIIHSNFYFVSSFFAKFVYSMVNSLINGKSSRHQSAATGHQPPPKKSLSRYGKDCAGYCWPQTNQSSTAVLDFHFPPGSLISNVCLNNLSINILSLLLSRLHRQNFLSIRLVCFQFSKNFLLSKHYLIIMLIKSN